MKLLQQAVKENSEPAELEAALTAAKLTPVQLDTFVRFWKVQRAKVHPLHCRATRLLICSAA